MCGEKSASIVQENCQLGSPPHVRGKEPFCFACCRCPGITPACAGKSLALPHPGEVVGDHPRMCGEKEGTRRNNSVERGSPPHVRGKAFVPAPMLSTLGITPACAGKSICTRSHAFNVRDHPRMCGEKLSKPPMNCSAMGSPPHVRGKVLSGSYC